MFDISFIEIVLIAVVSLLVLGPDKLPGAIRTAGLWIGRLKRSFNNIRSEIEREVGADEIRRQLRNEAIMDKIKHTRGQVTQSIQSVKDEVQSVKDSASIKNEVQQLNRSLNPTGDDTADTAGKSGQGPAESGTESLQDDRQTRNSPPPETSAEGADPASGQSGTEGSDSSDDKQRP